MKYRIIVDIYPKTIQGTNGCHKYVFEECKIKAEATRISDMINKTSLGKATVEKV